MARRRPARWLLGALLLGPLAPIGRAEDAAAPPRSEPISLAEGLRLEGGFRGARSLIHQDAVEAALVAGTWAPPKAGDTVAAPDGTTKAWEKVTASGTPPAFEGEAFTSGTYLSFRVPSAAERVAILHATGHDFVYVNGEVRPGDPYGYGWLRLPVLLRAGDNDLLFRVSRGRFTARLEEPPAEVFVLAEDATLPTCEADPTPGGRFGLPDGAVVVVNASPREAARVRLRCTVPGGRPTESAPVSVPALSVRKVPIQLPEVPTDAIASGKTSLVVTPLPSGPVSTTIPWDGAAAGDPVRRVTFTSGVDGSVQYYATCEPRPTLVDAKAPLRALVLSLHGAGVEAGGQAASYAPKRWATIVCPTNRRPFGFDWEDWGRLDAMEALGAELAAGRYDRARVHVTGHSMGGHGAWQLGVTCPDHFATVAPSAGWVSFASYAGGPSGEPADPVEAMLRRAASSSDTLALAGNLATKGVYVLHGDADDNVPVTEARTMVGRLTGLVADLHVHEEKGAGHWWDASPDEPGTDCVDWAPMFDLMARRRVPSPGEVREIDFTTASPGVSSRLAWAEIACQERMQVPSRVRLRLDPGRRRITGTTENVRRLHVRPDIGGEPITVSLDGSPDVVTPHSSMGSHRIGLVRLGGVWSMEAGDPSGGKNPDRCGPFKEAFRHRFAFVVGTSGTPEESAWAARKARLDAEAWWYRGNGTVEVMDDRRFLETATEDRRNVILYGHADMNAAWTALVGDGPVRVGRGALRVGEREVKGEDLACLFVRPRPGTTANLVGVVAGTGLPGLRLTDRLPYLASGVGVPDLVVISTSMLAKGAAGLVGAGFFGPDWSVESGEFAWREAAAEPAAPR